MAKSFDFEQYNWAHIWQQWSYHGPARIRATPKALEAMRDAITLALETGAATCPLMAHDGEGYNLEIERIRTRSSLGKYQYLFSEVEDAARELVERKRHWPKRTSVIAEAQKMMKGKS